MSPRQFLSPALLAVAGATAVMLMPALAHAGPPFAQAGTTFSSDARDFVAPFAVGILVVIGVMAFAGRIPWGYFGAFFLGCLAIYGGPQILAWVRAVAGI